MSLEGWATIHQIADFLSGTQAVVFSVLSHPQECYRWIEAVLVKFRYARLGKRDKGVVRQYLIKVAARAMIESCV